MHNAHIRDFFLSFLINRTNRTRHINPKTAVIINIFLIPAISAIKPNITPATITPMSNAPEKMNLSHSPHQMTLIFGLSDITKQNQD